MPDPSSIRPGARGVLSALAAAVLFGASTPLAKLLLGRLDPVLMAGLLYLGSGVGLSLYRASRGALLPRIDRSEAGWLAGAVLCGGVLAPVLLLLGLSGIAASNASLLLNAEAVLTTVLAWLVFREHVSGRIVVGMAAIVAGSIVLSWPGDSGGSTPLGSIALMIAACGLWALDNNLTRKVAATEATGIAAVKGLVAGVANTGIAVASGATWPPTATVVAAMLVGLACYGASLSLFVLGLRELGTARTGAYFSVAPFVGGALAVPLLAEPVTVPLLVAGSLMAFGVWLHLTERHSHQHTHEALEHAHWHDHADGHHGHEHPPGTATGPHRHWHSHQETTHDHPHLPDVHHRHSHPH